MAIANISSNQHFEPVGIFAVGFLDSSAAILRRADKGVGMVDYAIYAGIYTLRHGIELFIKQMSIYIAYELRDPSLLYVPGHGLAKAWKGISAELASLVELDLESSESQAHLDVIDSVIEQLDEIDPKGQIFRYPEWVSTKTPRERIDQPPPFEVVNLGDWASTAEAVLEGAIHLLYVARERTAALAEQRGDPPIHFHATVLNMPQR